MSKKHLTAAALATGALVLAPAAGAFALAPFPDGDRMYSAGYWEADFSGSNEAFWSVAPGAPTTLTVIEAEHDDPPSITDGAYDPTTGTSYLLGYGYGPACQLWSVDVETGAYAFIAEITQTEFVSDGTPDPADSCNALEILDDGTAYVTIFDTELFTLNLADGVTEHVGTFSTGDDLVSPRVLTTDPVTGITYAMSDYGETYEVDLSDAAATFVTSHGGTIFVHDADFDSDGVMWIVDWFGTSARLLSITDMNNMPGTLEMGAAVEGWYSDAIWIVPAQDDGPEPPAEDPGDPDDELATTGTESAPLMLGASILLLLGAIAVIRRRRTAQ